MVYMFFFMYDTVELKFESGSCGAFENNVCESWYTDDAKCIHKTCKFQFKEYIGTSLAHCNVIFF